MTIALSVLQVSLDGWVVATLAMLIVWFWQGLVRRDAPPLLSIEPDDLQLRKQRVFIQRIDRLRRYVIGFMTASAVLGVAVVVAWLHQLMQ